VGDGDRVDVSAVHIVGAAAAYKAHRNQQAAETAGRAEEAALQGARARVRQAL